MSKSWIKIVIVVAILVAFGFLVYTLGWGVRLTQLSKKAPQEVIIRDLLRVELVSKTPELNLKIGNIYELESLLSILGYFISPNAFNPLVGAQRGDVSIIRLIVTSDSKEGGAMADQKIPDLFRVTGPAGQPISIGQYRLDFAAKTLECIIYVSPDWLKNPFNGSTLTFNDMQLADTHLINYQFAQLLFYTATKKTPEALELLKQKKTLYGAVLSSVQKWQDAQGTNLYPVQL